MNTHRPVRARVLRRQLDRLDVRRSGRRFLPPSSRFSRFLSRAAACLLVLALGAGAAGAQSSVELVGNTGQSTDARSAVGLYRAQAFTTGGNSAGYKLTAVEIEATNTPSHADGNLVAIFPSNASNQPHMDGFVPVGVFKRTQAPAGIARFTRQGYNLDPNTTYFAILWPGSSEDGSGYDLTNSDAEDSGVATGWSIGDGSLWKSASDQAWTTADASLKMTFHGRGRAKVAPTRATVNGSSLTLTFDQNLDEDSVPAAGAFRVKTFHGAGHGLPRCTGWCTFAASAVSVTGSTVTLTLPRPIPSHGDAWLTYEAPAASPLRSAELGGLAGGLVESFRERGVGVLTPNTAPVFESAYIALGKYLWIVHNEVVTGDSVPGSAFRVTATSEGGARRTIAGTGTVHISAPSADGYSGSVRVTLASKMAAGERLRLSYVKPSGNRLRDRADAPVESYSDEPVTNGQPRVEAVEIVSDPQGGDGDTYSPGETIRVQVTFDVPVIVRTGGGVPRLKLDLTPRTFRDRHDERWAVYEGGSDTDTLTFAYTVTAAATEHSMAGIAVPANGLERNGGRFIAWSSFGLPPVEADLAHAGLDHDPAHKVDRRISRPTLSSVSVDWKVLTATFNQGLDPDSVPAPGAFTVSVAGVRRNVAPGGVAIAGADVTLTLEAAVAPDETVTLGYAEPTAGPLRGAAYGMAVESFADEAVTNDTEETIWSATLTVKGGAFHDLGCWDHITPCIDALTDDSFIRGGTSYRITRVTGGTSGAWDGSLLILHLTNAISRDWTLHVADQKYRVADATLDLNGRRATWAVDLAWWRSQNIPLRLTTSGSGGGGSGGSGPSHLSSSVSGTRLKVTFDEALDEGSAPPGGSFKVTVTPGGGAGANGGAFGTGAQATSGGNAGGDIEGTGTVTVDGADVTVTLARPAPPGATLTVSYTPPDTSPLRDLEGDEAEEFSGAPVTRGASAVESVAVVSDAGSDDTYALGQKIRVAVTFSEAVVVDTAGGAPGLTIDMDPADWGEKRAAYESGSGTATLTFTHTVVEPNHSTQGVAVVADSLAAGGGTIRTAADGTDAALAHAGLDHDPKHKVDWTLAPEPNRAPVVNAGAAEYDAFTEAGNAPRGMLVSKPFNGLFSDPDGDELTYTVALADPGRAALVEMLRIPTPEELGEYADDVRRAQRVFFRADANADWDAMNPAVPDPVEIAVTVTATDPGGLTASVEGVFLTHWGPPKVRSVAVVSDPGPDDTYGLGETIRVAVRFDGQVAADTSGGVPRLAIDMDPADWGRKWASYAGGNGTTELVFAYEVVEPNYSTEGIAVLADSLELNGGAIRQSSAHFASATDGMDAVLGHPGLGHDPKHKVDWQGAPTPGAPEATGVAVASDAGDDDTYGMGDVIRVAVTFGEAVTVTGRPSLAIDMDPAPWGEKRAVYESGSGTASLVFAHTVVEPNYSTEGIAVLANSLALEGGAIRSASGANAALAHAALAHNAMHKVDWRPELSVADAEANEGAGAAVEFAVSLSRAFTTAAHAVTVDYATADGTATAGEDYTAASGTLTFAAGETVKTVRVALLDDAIDEGSETFTLRLSNATGARIADGEATGTIVNSDPMPRAWLARFGRAAAEHVTDAIGERLRGSPGTRMTLGGHELDWSADPDALPARGSALLTGSGPGLAGGGPLLASANGFGRGLNERTGEDGEASVRELSMPDLLLASSFHMASADGGSASASGRWSVWGRGARSSFEGVEGRLTIEGDVTTATLGFDYERGLWLAGVALSRSSGEGSYEESGMKGEVESSLTGVYPYARYRVSESLSLWGVVGFGAGDMTLEPEGTSPIETDIETGMAAAGARGVLLPARAAGGFELALRADLMATATASDAARNLVETEVETSRLRLLLEASREFRTGDGSALAASVEAGLRYDGGDAETGSGLEAGGSLRWNSGGLSVEVAARGLMAHSEDDYEEWGVSGSVQYAQAPDGRGFSMRAGSAWGAAAGGAERIWSQRAAGLAGGDFAPGAGFDAEAGYGFGFRGGLLTPYTGVALSDSGDTWRAGARWKLGAATEVSLEANLRENASGDDPESGLLLKGSRRW